MADNINSFVLSSSVVDVLVGNPGLNLTLGDAAQFELEADAFG